MGKVEVTPDEKEFLEKRREELSKDRKLGEEIAKKMEYIVESFREDPTRIKYVRGAIGYECELNPTTLRVAIDQVYDLCRDIREGRVKTE